MSERPSRERLAQLREHVQRHLPYLTEIFVELDALTNELEAHIRKAREYQAGATSDDAALLDAEREIAALRVELTGWRNHQCVLPASIIDALNSGDGTYHP